MTSPEMRFLDISNAKEYKVIYTKKPPAKGGLKESLNELYVYALCIYKDYSLYLNILRYIFNLPPSLGSLYLLIASLKF